MLRVGQQVGSYRLLRLLGKGSFAEVYLGEDIRLGAQVAIKLLHAQLVDSDELEKFEQEARTIARLEHPNIVRIRHFAIEAGTPYLVMDYAPNGSLRQRVTRGQPAAPADIAPYVQQVAEALQHAHNQKLIHRDIKPENMLLGRYNEVLLSDFGIAVALQQTRTHQTVQGFSGTPIYAAPEQFKGQVSPASDQYALAVVVYEWLTGERPFQGDDIIAIGMAKTQQPPPPLREKIPALSPQIEEAVLTALATVPKERFAHVRAFANAFAQAAQSAAPPSRVVSIPAPMPAPPTVPTASAPFPQATIPVAQPPFPQATMPAMPAETNILAAPTQKISNPLPDTIRVAPQAQPGSALAPTQVEIVEQPRSKSKQSGPTPQKPPAPEPPRPPSASARHRLPKGRRRVIALSALAALLLIFGGLGYLALVGVTLKDTYTITTTSGATNVLRQQVNSRQVSIGAGYYSQAAPATGGPTPATQARGALDFINSSPRPVSLSKGLTLDDSPGGPGCKAPIQMVLDADITIPASPDGQYGQPVAAPAHVLQYGSVGNIPAWPDTRCFSHYEGQGGQNGTSFSGWIVQNDVPFTGGRNGIVQQSDIDGAANSLKATYPTPADPSSELSVIMRANERLLQTPAPSCHPEITADYTVGEKAGQVTVALSFICTGYVYDDDGVAQVSAKLLAGRAPPLFKPNGEITANVTSAALTDPQHATIRLTVAAQGVWVLRP